MSQAQFSSSMARRVLLAGLVLGGCAPAVVQPPPQAGVPQGIEFSTCPWPSKGTVNEAMVRVRVLVGIDGRPKGVEVVEAQPANQGFGERAEECIMKKTFEAGVVANGSPTQSWTPIFRIDFAR